MPGIIGFNTIGATTDTANNGSVEWNHEAYVNASGKTLVASSGDAVNMVAIYGASDGTAIVGIYTVNSGSGLPETLVDSVAVTIGTAAAWYTAPANIALTAGVEYTVAIDYLDGAMHQWTMNATDTGATQMSSDGTGALPSTWSSSSTGNFAVSVYAVVGFPGIAAVGGEIGTSLGSNNAQTLPTGSTTGSLVVVWVTNDNPSTTLITASTGWAEIFTGVVTGNVVRHACFARILDGGANDTLSISGASQDYCVSSARIINHGVADVTTDIKKATPATNTSGNADPPSLDAGTSKNWLWLSSAGVDFTTGNTISANPTSYVLVDNRTSASSTSSCGQRIAYRPNTTQTEDPGTYTNTSQEWVAGTIAIPPTASSVDGTATPAAITLAVTLPAASAGEQGTATPAVITTAATLPAPTVNGAGNRSPAAITTAATLPAVTTKAGATASPATIATAVEIAVATSVDQTVSIDAAIVAPFVPQPATASGGGAATATPAAISTAATLPAPTATGAGNATPAATTIAVTIPQVTASGGGSATALPSTITIPVTLPAPILAGAGNAAPAATTVTVDLPAPTVSGAGSTTPAVIPVAVTIPQATGTGANPGTATPAAITTTVTIPAVTPRAGWTATPGTTAVTFELPAVSAGGSKTTTPAVIPITVAVPGPTLQQGSAGVPDVIAVVTAVPNVTTSYGYVVSPTTIILGITLGAVIAQGTPPDTAPVTVTLRDADHTVTVRIADGGTLLRGAT